MAGVAYGGLGLPWLETMQRYGATDRLEPGLKLWPGGAQIDLKIGAVRSTSASAGLSIAVDPAIGYSTLNGKGVGLVGRLTPCLPLLIGWRIGLWEFVVGVQGSADFLFYPNAAVRGLRVGGTVAVGYLVSDEFRVEPNFAVSIPVFSDDVSQDTGNPLNSLMPRPVFQVGVALMFGE
jgi:hypothetical protein